MPGKRLTTEEKARILALHEENVGWKEICDRTGRGKSAVFELLREAKTLPPGCIPPTKSVSGRPRKTSAVTDKLIRREVIKNPRITARELKAAHPDLLRDVAVRTLQERCQKHLKLPLRSPAKKPLLTKKTKQTRLAFAKKYEHWTEQEWRRVMWSDESTFQCGAKKRGKLRRPQGANKYDSRYVETTVKHPDSVMIWGCFSGEMGCGGFYELPKNVTMNSDLYIKVLEGHLVEYLDSHKCEYFQQDNAPCHKARKTMKWLDEHHIKVLDWPPNSPDLNPIEEMWGFMKKKLETMDSSRVPCLVTSLKELWMNHLPLDYCKKLSESMCRRVKAVLKARGGHTKY